MPSELPKTTTVRMDPDLRPALQAYATATRRSMSGAVNFLVREALGRIDADREAPQAAHQGR